MIKEIAQIFDRYDSVDAKPIIDLIEHKYVYEAEILYEHFDDLNIYDDKTLRQYVQAILDESLFAITGVEVCEEMIQDLHLLLFKY